MYLVHEKTGAKLTLVCNEDKNRAFSLVFGTRAENDKGLPHAAEHVVLDGSEKYPSFSIFDNLSHQTYNTYANAYTDSSMTDFGAASLSEEELFRWADFYLDSCFHPCFLEDASIFDREVWHYRLEEKEGPLLQEGVVLSEMRGEDAESLLQRETYRLAFPGHTCGRAYAGEEEEIPEMSCEELIAFHRKYYHPSNVMVYLYGDFSFPERFLSLFDQVFSSFEKREMVFPEEGYLPLPKGARLSQKIPYPVEEGMDVSFGCLASFSFVLFGVREDKERHLTWESLCSLLDAPFSPVTREVKKALPGATFECALGMDGPEDLLTFFVRHIEEGQKEVFWEALLRGLTTFVETGFEKEALLSAEKSREISRLFMREEKNVGVESLHEMAYYYETLGNPFGYLEEVAFSGILSARKECFQREVRLLLQGDNPSIHLLLYPLPGEKERRQLERERTLEQVKALLTEEEIGRLLRESEEEEEDEEEIGEREEKEEGEEKKEGKEKEEGVGKEKEEREKKKEKVRLSALSVASLPEEVPLIPVREECVEGIRFVEAPLSVPGFAVLGLYFDMAGFSMEQLHYLHLLEDFTGRVGTSSHTREETAIFMERYLAHFSWGFSLMGKGKNLTPWYSLEWICRQEDMGEAYTLLYEILFTPDFSDEAWLRQQISLRLDARKHGLEDGPQDCLQLMAMSRGLSPLAYENYYGELSYVSFLQRIYVLLGSPEGAKEVRRGLKDVVLAMKNQTHGISTAAGTLEALKVHRQEATRFWKRLPSLPIILQSLSFPRALQREALILDMGSAVNVLAGDFETLGFSYSSAWEVIVEVVSDLYLFPVLREEYGVYTPYALIDEEAGLAIVSFQDPNIGKTLEALEGLPAFLESLELQQETLDGYILSAYTSYALTEGPLGQAREALSDYLDGYTREEYLEEMRTLKKVTPKTIRESAPIFRALLTKGAYLTAASATAIHREAGLFERIHDPFGRKE